MSKWAKLHSKISESYDFADACNADRNAGHLPRHRPPHRVDLRDPVAHGGLVGEVMTANRSWGAESKDDRQEVAESTNT